MKFKFMMIFLVSFCFCHIFGEEELPKYNEEYFKKLTISELFDIGGKPTGAWYMNGMPWSVGELKKRPAKEVITEAVKRLKNKPKFEYDQVFTVYCLVEIFHENEEVSRILHKAYPKLEPEAQYEILLYACENRVELFKDCFRDKLKKFQPPYTRSDMLSVLFFNMYPDKKMKKYLEVMEQTKLENDYYLDGFPYSDVVSKCVHNPRERIREAINMIEYANVTTEEKILIEKTRNMILKPIRASIEISNLSLSEVLKSFKLKYNQYDFLVGESVKNKLCSLNIKNATVYEALCEFANSNLLSISSEINGIKFYESTRPNNYWAKNGIFARVYISPGPENAIYGMIQNIDGLSWLNFDLPKVGDVNIVLADDSIYNCGRNAVFAFPITKELYESKGGYIKELTATISVPVPKVIKRKTISFEEAKKFDSTFCGRNLKINISINENNSYIVKVNSNLICGDIFSNSNYDKGSVIILDINKNIIEYDCLSVSNLKSNYSIKTSVKPEFFEWTVTTEVEFIKVPISFKNIKIPDSYWPK